VKLLLDQSLAPRIVPAIIDLFPGSACASDAGLARAEDAALWLYARDRGCTLVSKSPDFMQRAMLLGHPPKVLWLRGDCSTTQVIAALRHAAVALRAFEANRDQAVQILHMSNEDVPHAPAPRRRGVSPLEPGGSDRESPMPTERAESKRQRVS
jgi:predicted nuclease of predicted toxin-antitoxin system